jgi:hypothetical protein
MTKDNQWGQFKYELDTIPALKAALAAQEETIIMLTAQLSNEKLKNANLEAIAKCTCKK